MTHLIDVINVDLKKIAAQKIVDVFKYHNLPAGHLEVRFFSEHKLEITLEKYSIDEGEMSKIS